MNGTIQKRRFCLLKQSFYIKSLSLHFFYNLDLIFLIKDRQHRSRGRLEFSFITPEPKEIEGRVICHIKASIFLYSLVCCNMECLIYY